MCLNISTNKQIVAQRIMWMDIFFADKFANEVYSEKLFKILGPSKILAFLHSFIDDSLFFAKLESSVLRF